MVSRRGFGASFRPPQTCSLSDVLMRISSCLPETRQELSKHTSNGGLSSLCGLSSLAVVRPPASSAPQIIRKSARLAHIRIALAAPLRPRRFAAKAVRRFAARLWSVVSLASNLFVIRRFDENLFLLAQSAPGALLPKPSAASQRGFGASFRFSSNATQSNGAPRRALRLIGAGYENRTHVSSLEGWCSTIELHPRIDFFPNAEHYITAFRLCQQIFSLSLRFAGTAREHEKKSRRAGSFLPRVFTFSQRPRSTAPLRDGSF